MPIVLTHSAPSVPAERAKLSSSKLSQLFWGLNSGAAIGMGSGIQNCCKRQLCVLFQKRVDSIWVGCSWLHVSSDALSSELSQTHSLGTTSEVLLRYLSSATFFFSPSGFVRIQPPQRSVAHWFYVYSLPASRRKTRRSVLLLCLFATDVFQSPLVYLARWFTWVFGVNLIMCRHWSEFFKSQLVKINSSMFVTIFGFCRC